MEEHRLRRFYPETPDTLLSDLFETLALEHGTEPATEPWTLDIDGITTRQHTLQDVDRHLSRQDLLENVRVRDPFGHIYRPVRHRKHRYLPSAAGVILYVEVPPRGGRLRATDGREGGLTGSPASGYSGPAGAPGPGRGTGCIRERKGQTLMTMVDNAVYVDGRLSPSGVGAPASAGGPHEQPRPAPLSPDPEAHGLGPGAGFLGRGLTI